MSRNEDKPGLIGADWARVFGEAGVNIATFNLGRAEQGGDAIALVAVDQTVNGEVYGKGARSASCGTSQGVVVLATFNFELEALYAWPMS